MEYTDLLTFEQLRSGALSSIDNLTSIGLQAEDAIADVTQIIEDYLDRDLIVRKHTLLHEDIDYRYDTAVSTDATSNYSFYTNQWPVVEVESVTPSGFTLEIHPDGRRLYTDFDGDTQPIRQVEYFAGYRRADQSLSDLQNDLPDLGTEPEKLPRTIRQVATRLTVHFLKEMESNVLGSRTVQTTGPVTVTVEGADTSFVTRELRRLNRYRRLA